MSNYLHESDPEPRDIAFLRKLADELPAAFITLPGYIEAQITFLHAVHHNAESPAAAWQQLTGYGPRAPSQAASSASPSATEPRAVMGTAPVPEREPAAEDRAASARGIPQVPFRAHGIMSRPPVTRPRQLNLQSVQRNAPLPMPMDLDPRTGIVPEAPRVRRDPNPYGGHSPQPSVQPRPRSRSRSRSPQRNMVATASYRERSPRPQSLQNVPEQREIPLQLTNTPVLPERPQGPIGRPQLYLNTHGRTQIYPSELAWRGTKGQSCGHGWTKITKRYNHQELEEKRCDTCWGKANFYQVCKKCKRELCKYCMGQVDVHHRSMNSKTRREEKELQKMKKEDEQNELQERYDRKYEAREREEDDANAHRLKEDAEAAERADARKRERDDEDEARARRRRGFGL